MNLLFSCIGKRGYMAPMFRPHLAKGDRIIGTSNTQWTPGFNACDSGFLMPGLSSPDYVPAMLELCRREKVDALLSFFDTDVHVLSMHREAFEALGVKCFLPSQEIAAICFDKWHTFKYLTAQGFATPMTYKDLPSVRRALDEGSLHFPVYIKPRSGFGSRNTFKARNWNELEVFNALEPDMIIQETMGGEAYDFDILNDLSGRAVGVVPWRKSLSRMGETEQAETVHFPELVALGERLANTLGHAGPLDADLFVEDGRISVLEINLRFGGGYPVSHLAGADFPAAIVRMARGEPHGLRMGNYRSGVVMMKELHPMGGPSDTFFKDVLHVDRTFLHGPSGTGPSA